MALLENVGYITLLLQQLSTIFVISTSLLVIYTSDTIWYPGYFFLLMSTGPLLLYCVYGTIVETKVSHFLYISVETLLPDLKIETLLPNLDNNFFSAAICSFSWSLFFFFRLMNYVLLFMKILGIKCL